MSTLDIVLVAVAALCVIIGLAKGVLKQLFSLGSIVLAIAASYFLCAPVYEFASTESIGSFQPYEMVEEKVYELAVDKLGESVTEVITQETIEAQISNALEEMGVPKLLTGYVYDALSDQIVEIEGKSLGDLFIPMLSSYVLKIICYVLIFLVAFIVLKIVFGILKKLLNIGVFKFVDRLCGAAIGVVLAAIFANVIMLALSFLTGVIPSLNDFITSDLEASMGLARYFYDHNWISYLIAHSFDFQGLIGEITATLPELQ